MLCNYVNPKINGMKTGVSADEFLHRTLKSDAEQNQRDSNGDEIWGNVIRIGNVFRPQSDNDGNVLCDPCDGSVA